MVLPSSINFCFFFFSFFINYYKELIKTYGGFPISYKPIEELRDIFILRYPFIGLVEYVNDSYIIIREHKDYPIKEGKAIIVSVESGNDIKYINFNLV